MCINFVRNYGKREICIDLLDITELFIEKWAPICQKWPYNILQ